MHCIFPVINHCKMVTTKKSKKVKQPLGIRVIKIIVIALMGTILLAAIAERLFHLYRHMIK